MAEPISDQNLKATDSEASIHLENVSPTNDSPQDPRNWPQWKKNAQILMVAFHSCVSTFMAAGIIPAYDVLAEDYGVTVPDASYLTSFQVCDPSTLTTQPQ